MVDQTYTVYAPAKVNLFLHITGRRDNGYHELESLFVFTKKGDRITVQKADGLTLETSGPFAGDIADCQVDDNLVMKAARLLIEAYSVKAGAHISLEKNIPVASGIGGGSSDAATTLIALNSLWGLNLEKGVLAALALELGADVPACLRKVPLWVTGVGELVEPVSLTGASHILLVNPLVAVSTAEIFRDYKQTSQKFDRAVSEGTRSEILVSPEALQSLTGNSLQGAAEALCPDIRAVIDLIGSTKGVRLARMSGSGATCFGLYDSEEDLRAAEELIRDQRPNWWLMSDQISS